ncbi:citrate-binding protein-like [Hevea brasiliensis]|uniref:citrate-binding protein-like n=1 Tax=Hevea brasiliensis TaxID=3981 RepID=UPI0025F7EA3A|nr:citrate-binding protein-like [Hevea brasiliensis]
MASNIVVLSCLLCICLFELLSYQAFSWGPIDATKGFISLHLNHSNFVIQRPYDVPEHLRYSFKHGVHKLWVYSTDKPHSPTSSTNPRTEIRIHGYDYSSGVWQFEAHGYVPNGTSGVCIMQVFGASPHATTPMLRVYNGSLSYYRAPVIVPCIYNRWFKLNVIHDVDGSSVKVYIDGILTYEAPGRGGTSHYFKCGVYAQNDDSYYMESRWKGIKIFKKCDY